jgi:hypothetical protein
MATYNKHAALKNRFYVLSKVVWNARSATAGVQWRWLRCSSCRLCLLSAWLETCVA